MRVAVPLTPDGEKLNVFKDTISNENYLLTTDFVHLENVKIEGATAYGDLITRHHYSEITQTMDMFHIPLLYESNKMKHPRKGLLYFNTPFLYSENDIAEFDLVCLAVNGLTQGQIFAWVYEADNNSYYDSFKLFENVYEGEKKEEIIKKIEESLVFNKADFAQVRIGYNGCIEHDDSKFVDITYFKFEENGIADIETNTLYRHLRSLQHLAYFNIDLADRYNFEYLYINGEK